MKKRNRTISWEEEADVLAVRLAAERNCNVSELLAQLVLEEKDHPRLILAEPSPGYKAHISQSKALGDSILKKQGKDAGNSLGSRK